MKQSQRRNMSQSQNRNTRQSQRRNTRQRQSQSRNMSQSLFIVNHFASRFLNSDTPPRAFFPIHLRQYRRYSTKSMQFNPIEKHPLDRLNVWWVAEKKNDRINTFRAKSNVYFCTLMYADVRDSLSMELNVFIEASAWNWLHHDGCFCFQLNFRLFNEWRAGSMIKAKNHEWKRSPSKHSRSYQILNAWMFTG